MKIKSKYYSEDINIINNQDTNLEEIDGLQIYGRINL